MARRFALISDIHANLTALDAVLADIDAAGIRELYCLGDIVGYGPDPSGAIHRVCERGIPTVRGNYDDGVGFRRGGCGCFYATPEDKADGAASYAFTDGAITAEDRAWLSSLPEQRWLEVEGRRVLLCHGSPRKINEYLMPDRPDAQLVRLAENAEADVVCCGHVHVPYHRQLAGGDGRALHYVNAGSVGRPKDGDPRACWVEVSVFEGDLAAETHRVDYDIETVARVIVALGLPAAFAEALRTG